MSDWTLGQCKCRECFRLTADVPDSICRACWQAYRARIRNGPCNLPYPGRGPKPRVEQEPVEDDQADEAQDGDEAIIEEIVKGAEEPT